MNDWKYSRRHGLCSSCTRAFAEQEQHYSLLWMRDGALVREDRCPGCFGAAASAEFGATGGLAYWRTRYAPGAGLRLDLDSLEALFLTLVARAATEAPAEVGAAAAPAEAAVEPGAVSEARPAQDSADRLGELCYLLGLLLLRKRRLKLDRIAPATGEARERLVVHRPRRPQSYEIAVYDLTPERQGELRDELKRIFEGAELVQLLEGAANAGIAAAAGGQRGSDA